MPDPRPWEAIRHLNHLHFAGGFVGGLAARMATIPLEAVLTQTQPNRILDPPTQARLARHGRSMITLGLSACPRLAAFHGAQFMVAGAVDAVFFPDEQPGGQVLPGQQPPTVPEYMAQHFACGALGTAAAALMCAPFDAIDHHITFRNKTFLGAIQAVWHEGGLRGFYARSPPVLGTALLYGGLFMVQATVRVPLTHGGDHLDPVPAYALAGALAGIVTHALAFPFRRRLLRRACGPVVPGLGWPTINFAVGSLRACLGCGALFGARRLVWDVCFPENGPRPVPLKGSTAPSFASF